MFTGIVNHCGEIEKIEKNDEHYRLTIRTQFNDLVLGESIAVEGICLTVVAFAQHQFQVELSPETLSLTTAANFFQGKKVNLERALRLMDRLGGHFVTGHIDGQSEVESLRNLEGGCVEISFHQVDKNFQKYLLKKGSIAINGVSLTINEVTQGGFQIIVIPHTQQRTSFSDIKQKDKVNLEYDYLAKLTIDYCHAMALACN